MPSPSSSNGTVRRVAVVTGGAAGIGQAYAVRLAQDGHAVAIADIANADETVGLVRACGGEAVAIHCDVSSAQSVELLFGEIEASLGLPDILIHNAGIYPVTTFEGTDWATWRRIMDVNLDSAFHLTKAALPNMRRQGWGRIVMMATANFHTGNGLVAYTASKGGIIGMVRALASEVGVDGITVNAVSPGVVRTHGTMSGPHEAMGIFEGVKAMQAIKRTQLPEDLVGVVSFLASDQSSFMTGQTLVVDGGLSRV